MAKLTLTNVATLEQIITAVNNNNDAIENAVENTLSRDGTTPNTMSADLDLNGYRIINAGEATQPTHFTRLGDVEDIVTDLVNEAIADVTQGPPGPASLVFKGAYSGATAYVVNDVVNYNSSSWVNIAASTNNTPPALPTTSNTWWSLLAAKGTDGAGTGDVVGPNSSIDGEIALFNSTTGKLIKRASTTGILKAASGVLSAAVSGTDYAPATSGTSVLKGNGSGGFSSASASDLSLASIASSGSASDLASGTVPVARLGTSIKTACIQYVIDGGGSTITTGVKGDIMIPWDCTITHWFLMGNTTGSIVIDIWRDLYTNYPPTVGDTITASAKPTLSSANFGGTSSLTGWSTSCLGGHTLRINVDSVSTLSSVTLYLQVTKV